jgi:hypothetical protein
MMVWVLLIYMGGFNQGGPVVIDNIESKAACVQLQTQIKAKAPGALSVWSECMEVRKMK